jgi:hypothetical protein
MTAVAEANRPILGGEKGDDNGDESVGNGKHRLLLSLGDEDGIGLSRKTVAAEQIGNPLAVCGDEVYGGVGDEGGAYVELPQQPKGGVVSYGDGTVLECLCHQTATYGAKERADAVAFKAKLLAEQSAQSEQGGVVA